MTDEDKKYFIDFEDIYQKSLDEEETESFFRNHPKDLIQTIKNFVLTDKTFQEVPEKVKNALRASIQVFTSKCLY